MSFDKVTRVVIMRLDVLHASRSVLLA